jgi:hypothetical protein
LAILKAAACTIFSATMEACPIPATDSSSAVVAETTPGSDWKRRSSSFAKGFMSPRDCAWNSSSSRIS